MKPSQGQSPGFAKEHNMESKAIKVNDLIEEIKKDLGDPRQLTLNRITDTIFDRLMKEDCEDLTQSDRNFIQAQIYSDYIISCSVFDIVPKIR